ncbi:hypothetical protein PTKIN_Ptkin10aG0030600 [Pterospermum kingtungense]
METRLPQSKLKTKPQIESRVKTLKRQYNLVAEMLALGSGFGWDDVEKYLTASKDVFDDWVRIGDNVDDDSAGAEKEIETPAVGTIEDVDCLTGATGAASRKNRAHKRARSSDGIDELVEQLVGIKNIYQDSIEEMMTFFQKEYEGIDRRLGLPKVLEELEEVPMTKFYLKNVVHCIIPHMITLDPELCSKLSLGNDEEKDDEIILDEKWLDENSMVGDLCLVGKMLLRKPFSLKAMKAMFLKDWQFLKVIKKKSPWARFRAGNAMHGKQGTSRVKNGSTWKRSSDKDTDLGLCKNIKDVMVGDVNQIELAMTGVIQSCQS